MVQYIPLVE